MSQKRKIGHIFSGVKEITLKINILKCVLSVKIVVVVHSFSSLLYQKYNLSDSRAELSKQFYTNVEIFCIIASYSEDAH